MPGFARTRVAKSTLVSTGKARLATAILLLVGLAACSSPAQRALDELVREGELVLSPETMEPYSGLAFASFQGTTNATSERLKSLEGSYEGPFAALPNDHHLSSREVYENGLKHGPYEWYFENGRVFEEGTYVQGRLEGPFRAYWETGELYEEGTYRSGEFEGPRRWYLNGRLVELVTYRRGVIEGLYERYSDDGLLELKGMLYDGLACGTWIEDAGIIRYPACGRRITE